MRQNSIYICQQCNYQSSSYLGKCPQCDSWNSLVETLQEFKSTSTAQKLSNISPLSLNQIKIEKVSRITTGISEFDRVLGGKRNDTGFVSGSVILLAGDPGIGKSTLLLQLAISIAKTSQKVLYISGEESLSQIKLRADRLFGESNHKNLYVISAVNVESILSAVMEISPQVIVVDSIQTMQVEGLSGSPGSVGQVRETAARFHRLAKQKNITVFLIGHVTKEGAIAGPKTVEHLVDVVLYLEGEEYRAYRILRGVKNRFGAVMEVGMFEMKEDGLISLNNPSKAFLEMRQAGVAGSVVVATIAGSRPILAEIQALASPTPFGLPKRVATGLDYNRMQMILAVLSKKYKLPLSSLDIYINVAGGIKIYEPAADLAIAVAVASSAKLLPVGKSLVAVGEIGLLGELRPVFELERRLSEAKKLGFANFLTYQNAKTIDQALNIALKKEN